MTDQLAGFTPITDLIDRIMATGNEYPKIRLAFGEDSPLVLTRCGEKSRTPGAVNLTDGGPYGANLWFGRIGTDGRFQPGRDARNLDSTSKRALWSVLSRMRDGDAESVFAEYGHKFGRCCMCGRELSNPESVELGIGPICREKAFA